MMSSNIEKLILEFQYASDECKMFFFYSFYLYIIRDVKNIARNIASYIEEEVELDDDIIFISEGTLRFFF